MSWVTCTLPECTIPGWWPVKVYSFCNISISFLVHFHLHFYSFLFYFLPVIVHHVPSLSYHFLRCPIIVYEVANEFPNEFANKILDGVPDEVANEVANEQTSNPQKIKLPMIITWSCTWWRNKVEVKCKLIVSPFSNVWLPEYLIDSVADRHCACTARSILSGKPWVSEWCLKRT